MRRCPRCGADLMPVLYDDAGRVVAAICPDMCHVITPPSASNLTIYYRPHVEWHDNQLELSL